MHCSAILRLYFSTFTGILVNDHTRIVSPQYQRQSGTGTKTALKTSRIILVQVTPSTSTTWFPNRENTATKTFGIDPLTPITSSGAN